MVIRKITSYNDIFLTNSKSYYVTVNYTTIPKERNFTFYLIHKNVTYGIINTKTPQIVTLINTTPSLITIRKRS